MPRHQRREGCFFTKNIWNKSAIIKITSDYSIEEVGRMKIFREVDSSELALMLGFLPE